MLLVPGPHGGTHCSRAWWDGRKAGKRLRVEGAHPLHPPVSTPHPHHTSPSSVSSPSTQPSSAPNLCPWPWLCREPTQSLPAALLCRGPPLFTGGSQSPTKTHFFSWAPRVKLRPSESIGGPSVLTVQAFGVFIPVTGLNSTQDL